MMQTEKRSAAVLLVAALLLGVLVGTAGTVLAAHKGIGSLHYHPERQRRGPREYFDRLTAELNLTATQRDSVQSVLDRNRASMDSIWHEVSPRFETLRGRLRSEIRNQLTPEQQATFDEMSRKNDSMRMRSAPR